MKKHLFQTILLSCFMITGIFAAPVLDSAQYDEEFDILRLYFDQPLNDGLMNTSGFIEVSVDEGTVEYQAVTTPFSEVSGTADDNIIELQLTTPDATYIEGWSTVTTNLEVSLGASVFFDQSSNGNAVVSYTDNIAVRFLTTEPQVRHAAYDAETDKLTVTFTRALNDGAFDTYGNIAFSVDEGSVNTRTLFTPLSEISTGTNDNQLVIAVSSSDATVIEGWANLSTNLELSLTASLVSSLSSATGNILLGYSDNTPITYIPQNPAIDSASYDSDTNILRLIFNRKLNDGSFNTYETVTLSKDNGSSSVTLMTPFGIVVGIANDNTVDIQVGASDATVIEGWTNLTDLEVQVGSSLIQSLSGYYNLAHTFADDKAVDYIVENPRVVYSEYDAEHDQVSIHFNRKLNDASLNVNASAGISVDNGGGNYIYFDTPLSEVSDSANDSILVFQLTAGTATTVEGWSNLETNLELEITSNMIQSESGYYNSTFSYVDNCQTVYNSANPKLVTAWYDADVDLLHLAFDRPLNDANFNSSPSMALSVDNGGTYFQYLTTPLTDVSTTANDSIVEFKLTGIDATTIEGWSNLETDLEINLSSSMVESFSGFQNEYISYSDDFQVEYIPAAPRLDSAIYYAECNKLVLIFNRQLNDANFNTSGSIYLSVDEGSLYYEWINNPLTDVSAVANDNIIELNLLDVEGTNIEGWSNLETNLEIEISGTLVQSQSGFNNQNIYYSDDQQVDFVLGDPLIKRASYDAETDILTVVFDHNVRDGSYFNTYAGIGFSVDNETEKYLLLSTPLTYIMDEHNPNDSIMQVQVNPTNAATIESWPNLETHLELEFADSIAVGVNDLTNHWYTYGDDIRIEYIKQEPTVTFAEYDAEDNLLTIQFNRDLDDVFYDTNAVIELSVDEGNTDNLIITTPHSDISSVTNDSTIQILLSDAQATTLESWNNLETHLEIQLVGDLVKSGAGFFNQKMYFNDNVKVAYDSPNPKLHSASYEGELNQLRLVFDRAVNDAAFDTSASVGLSVDEGGTDFLNLPTPFSDVSTTANDSIIIIPVSAATATTIEGWANLNTSLEVEITSNIVQSSSGFYNEYVYYSDNKQVEYIPANPRIAKAAYYAKIDILQLHFNRQLDDATFDTVAQMSLSVDNGTSDFQNITTPLSDVSSGTNDSILELQLTSGNATTVEGWTGVNSLLEIELNDTLIKSSSGLINLFHIFEDNIAVTYITNEAPMLLSNKGLTLDEGTAASLKDSLFVEDRDTDDSLIIFKVTTSPVNGQLEKSDNAGVAIDSFTQKDLVDGVIQYVHNGTETTGDTFSFTVSDEEHTIDEQQFLLSVTLINEAPTFTSIAVTSATEDIAYSYALSSEDGDGDTITYSTPVLPSWLSLEGDITVSTLAGSGIAGTTDGVGSAAQFNGPFGVAVDSSGNIIIADRGSHCIRKITPKGDVTTIAGSTMGYADGNGTSAQFTFPTGVAIDHNGNILVADNGNHRIRKITPDGEVSTLAGSSNGFADGTGTAAKFYYPFDIAVDSEGNIYVTDHYNYRVRKITAEGVVSTFAGSSYGYTDGTGTGARFRYLRGITIDPMDNIYVTEGQYSHRIRKITPDRVVTTVAGTGSAGSSNGTGTAASFNMPLDVASDALGNLYVSDMNNHRIRMIALDGKVTTVAGSSIGFANGVNNAAQFNLPASIVADKSGNVFVTESGNHLVRQLRRTTAQLVGTSSNDDVGIHAVTVRINDGTVSVDQSFNITVAGVNDTPFVLLNTGLTISEDSTALITASLLSGSDVDNVDSTLIYTITTLPVNGYIRLNGSNLLENESFTQAHINNNLVDYVHNGSNTSTDAFIFVLSDGTAELTNQTFSITINPVDDDVPTLVTNKGLHLDEGATGTIPLDSLEANDEDSDNLTLTYIVTTAPQAGHLEKSGTEVTTFTQQDLTDGLISYVHNGSNTTSDSFVFKVTDGASNELVNQTFNIGINAIDDDAPYLTKNNSLVLDEGATDTITIANHLDVDDDTVDPGSVENGITFTIKTPPVNGTLLFVEDTLATDSTFSYIEMVTAERDGNSLRYSHNGSNTTVDSMLFTLSDSANVSEVFTFVFTINPVNDKPVISSTPIGPATEDIEWNYTVLATDEESATEDLHYAIKDAPAGMSITNNVITWTPLDGVLSSGEVTLTVKDEHLDSVEQKFTIAVTPVNNAPTISRTGDTTTLEDTEITFIKDMFVISDEETPLEDLILTVLGGDNYSVSANVLKPALNYDSDLFVNVEISDGYLKDTTTVTVSVIPVNDPPTIVSLQDSSIAEESAITFTKEMFTLSDVETSTADLILTVLSGGNYTVINNTVTPIVDFNGDLEVNVEISDGELKDTAKLTITVTPVNDAPILTSVTDQNILEDENVTVLLSMTNAKDVDNTLTNASIVLTPGDNYTIIGATVVPEANYNGPLTVPVKVTDGELTSEVVNMSITVDGVNDAPTLTTVDAQSTAEDTPFTVTLAMTNAADVDNSLTDASIILGAGANYTVTGQTITPALNYNGPLTVPVTVTDGELLSETVHMTVSVTPVNDAPTLSMVTAQSTAEDTPLVVTLAMTDAADVDNSLTDASIVLGAGANYTVAGQTITPALNFVGALTVPVTVTDGALNSVTVNMTVSVTPVNDAPVLTAATAQSTAEDTPLTVTLAMTDAADVDNTLTDASIILGAGANYTVAGQTITPALNFYGTLTVPVTVTDGALSSATVNMTVTVTPVNDAPVLTAATAQSTAEDTPLVVTLAMTDASDVDNTLTDASIILGAGANYTVTGQTITPALNYVGALTVPVTVTDGALSSATVNMIVTVTPVNDAPVLTAATAQSTAEDTPLALTLAMTNAVDSDGDALTLIVEAGANYTVSGTTITPTVNFNGVLTVPVAVTDGALNSATVNMTVTITPVNDKPVLTSATAQVTKQETPVTLTLDMTDASDIDGDALTLLVGTGENYVVEGTTVNPVAGFVGTLTVPVSVSDGALSSEIVNMTISVEPTIAIKESDEEATGIGAFAVAPNMITTESEAHFVIGEKLSGEGEIIVLDYLGDIIDEQDVSVEDGGHFYWDLRNSSGMIVTSGIYLVVLELDGKIYKRKIGIKK